MKNSRLFIVAFLILVALAFCLACIVVAWMWQGDNAATTPTPAAALPTATPIPPTMTPTPAPTSRLATAEPSPSPTWTPVPSAPDPTPTPVVITDPSLTDRALLEEQFRSAGVGQKLVLIVTDDHVEREIAAYMATQSGMPYRNITVNFVPGLMELGGEVEVVGLWVPATVRGYVTARDCVPKATITELEIGGILTPKWAKDYVAGLIYDVLDRYPDDLAVCLTATEVRQDEATVGGVKR